MRNPASNEMISDSVELWDTDVCFLHIQLMVTCSTSEYTGLTQRLISSPQGRQQSLSLGTDPISNAEPCYPLDKNVCSHLGGECMKSVLPNVCRKPEFIL